MIPFVCPFTHLNRRLSRPLHGRGKGELLPSTKILPKVKSCAKKQSRNSWVTWEGPGTPTASPARSSFKNPKPKGGVGKLLSETCVLGLPAGRVRPHPLESWVHPPSSMEGF